MKRGIPTAAAGLTTVSLLALAVGLLVGCAHSPVASNVDRLSPRLDTLFVLQFDTAGRLLNPTEVGRLTERLQSGGVESITIVSYGWNKDLHDYSQQLHAFEQASAGAAEVGDPTFHQRNVTVYAMWDSSSATIERLLTDITPFPSLAKAIGRVPDLMLFPLTFWPKAGLATKIAHGDLHDAIEYAITHAHTSSEEVPPIRMIGRSFGGRLVTSLASAFARDRERGDRGGGDIVIADHIAGLMLIQPAMSEADLRASRRHHTIPTLVTFSRHDRANGVLFPAAAILSNTAWQEVFPPMRSDTPPEERTALGELWWGTRSVLHEIGVTLLSTTTNILFIPGSYLQGQIHRFATEPLNHAMDTLAVLPVVQIPVLWWDNAGRDPGGQIPNWGDQGKGLFSLGARFDSIGRGRPTFSYPLLRGWSVVAQRWNDYASVAPTIEEVLTWDSVPAEATVENVLYIDCTDSINHTVSGLNMDTTWARLTLNHVAAMGAHEDMVPDEHDVDDPNRLNVIRLRHWFATTPWE